MALEFSNMDCLQAIEFTEEKCGVADNYVDASILNENFLIKIEKEIL